MSFLHEIPELILTSLSLKKLNISYATVHLLNGFEALKAANKAANDINVKLLGVTVLTSFDNQNLEQLGFRDQVEGQVLRLIKIANEANLHGVICSPLEIKIIKKEFLKIIGQTLIDNDIITYMIYIIAFWCKYFKKKHNV
mgnify:CR=1 FL=1